MTSDSGDAQRRREHWERHRRRMRLLQDAGLVLLALGVLVLAFIALTYRP